MARHEEVAPFHHPADAGPDPSTTCTDTGTGTQNYIPLFYDNNCTLANSVMYQSGSNIGIGTATPASIGEGSNPTILQLHHSGATGIGGLLELSTDQTATGLAVGGIAFGSTGLSNSDKRIASIYAFKTDASTVAGSGDLSFYTWNGGVAAEKMRILSSGNVGIGTTNPSGLLSVGSSSQFQVNSTGGVTAGGVTATSLNKRVYADQASGAPDACLQIYNAAQTLLGRGGIVDATGFQSSPTCGTNPLATQQPGILYLLGNTVYQTTVPWVVSATQTSIVGTAPFASGTPGGGTTIQAVSSANWITPVNISGASASGTTVTITTSSPHGFSVGQSVTVSGVMANSENASATAAGYNGIFKITGVTSTQFTYTAYQTQPQLLSATGGFASVGWIVDNSNPNNVSTCDQTGAQSGPGCAGTVIRNLLLSGYDPNKTPAPGPVAPNGLAVAQGSYHLGDGTFENIRIYGLNGGIGLSIGDAIAHVSLYNIDIQPSVGTIVGSIRVGVDMPGATLVPYYNLGVSGASVAGMQLGYAAGANIYGGVFSGNATDILVTSDFCCVRFEGFWFENSKNAIIANTTGVPRAGTLDIRDSHLHSVGTVAFMDFTNITGTANISGGEIGWNSPNTGNILGLTGSLAFAIANTSGQSTLCARDNPSCPSYTTTTLPITLKEGGVFTSGYPGSFVASTEGLSSGGGGSSPGIRMVAQDAATTYGSQLYFFDYSTSAGTDLAYGTHLMLSGSSSSGGFRISRSGNSGPPPAFNNDGRDTQNDTPLLTLTPNGVLHLTGNAGSVNPSMTQGLAAAWNYTNGGGEADFFQHTGGGSTGGFNYYNWNGSAATLNWKMQGSDASFHSHGPLAFQDNFSSAYIALAGSPTGLRTWTFQDATDTVVGRATTDTLTNKTLTSPALTTPTVGGGSTVNKILLGSQSLNFGAISAQACIEATPTLSGMTTGAVSWASPAASLGNTGLVWSAGSQTPGVVTVRLCNVTGNPITPIAVTWNIGAIQ